MGNLSRIFYKIAIISIVSLVVLAPVSFLALYSLAERRFFYLFWSIFWINEVFQYLFLAAGLILPIVVVADKKVELPKKIIMAIVFIIAVVYVFIDIQAHLEYS